MPATTPDAEEFVRSCAPFLRYLAGRAEVRRPASLRDIAKEVGIRAPSLYNYIKSKEKLLYELLKEPLQAMVQPADAVEARCAEQGA